MIGRFTGNDVPACGFSIGFERIITILLEQNFRIPQQAKKVAYLVEKGIATEDLCKVIARAQEERAKGTQVLVVRMNKNKKFQKEQLTKDGYEEFMDFYKEPLKK
jgi:histidyl-tRNA synthetase